MEEASLEPLLERIYDAVSSPDGWPGVFDALKRRIGLDGCSLIRFGERPEVLAAEGERISETARVRYEAHYGAIDPRAAVARSLPPGQWMLCHHRFDERFVQHDEFYQDFLLPEGLRYAAGGSLLHAGGWHYLIGLQRGPERGVFVAEDEALLRRLTPHLQRAVGLVYELQRQTLRADAAEAALQTTGLAVLAFDAGGRLLCANPRGEGLLRAGAPLRLRAGVVVAAAAAQQAAFEAALSLCARDGRPRTLLLRSGDEAGERYSLTVMRRRAAQPPWPARLALEVAGAHLLGLVSPLARRRVATAQQLIDLFGLSPAEARLARALAQGETVDTWAAASALKPSTLRTQLQAVFTKTGVKRQPDLVRLLTAVAPVREPAPPRG